MSRSRRVAGYVLPFCTWWWFLIMLVGYAVGRTLLFHFGGY